MELEHDMLSNLAKYAYYATGGEIMKLKYLGFLSIHKTIEV